MPRVDGIDVSEYQGVIDWPFALSTRLRWVGMRVWHDRLDKQFTRNRQGASPARWRPLYHYPQHGEDASRFISAVGELGHGEGAMLDAEATGITVDDCVRWCEQVEARWQRPAIVYTSDWVSGGLISTSPRIFNGQRVRIFSAFGSQADALRRAQPFSWDAWQWSDTGRVPGIAGPVDLDQIDNPAAFDRACGYGAEDLTISNPDDLKYLAGQFATLNARLV